MSAEFEVTLVKWGNSLGFILPKPIRDGMKLKAGDKIKIVVQNNRICIEKVDVKWDSHTFQDQSIDNRICGNCNVYNLSYLNNRSHPKVDAADNILIIKYLHLAFVNMKTWHVNIILEMLPNLPQ